MHSRARLKLPLTGLPFEMRTLGEESDIFSNDFDLEFWSLCPNNLPLYVARLMQASYLSITRFDYLSGSIPVIVLLWL